MGRARGTSETAAGFDAVFGRLRGAHRSPREEYQARQALLSESDRKYDSWLTVLGVYDVDESLVTGECLLQRRIREAVLALMEEYDDWRRVDLNESAYERCGDFASEREVKSTITMMTNGELEMYEPDRSLPFDEQILALRIRPRPNCPHPIR
jgi:hypothetical protein